MADVSGKSKISIRTPDDMIEAIDKIAAVLQRDRTWVMLTAFKKYLTCEGLDVLQDAARLASLGRGECIPFNLIMDRLEARIAKALAMNAS